MPPKHPGLPSWARLNGMQGPQARNTGVRAGREKQPRKRPHFKISHFDLWGNFSPVRDDRSRFPVEGRTF
jgi:hypothetical protein